MSIMRFLSGVIVGGFIACVVASAALSIRDRIDLWFWYAHADAVGLGLGCGLVLFILMAWIDDRLKDIPKGGGQP